MIFFLSLVTSAKDYFEIVHKLIHASGIIEFGVGAGAPNPNYSSIDYNEFGSLISYIILTIKNFFAEFLTLNWLQNLWSLPVIVPDIASAMISEISVLDGYFHNALTFLETPLSYGKQNYSIYGLQQCCIGLINSFFLFLPTSAAHIIMLRRFVFQGVEAGYIAGFGIIAGNVLWLASIIFGWRFFVIPWLSLDILRYLLGFVILIKYMWDSSHAPPGMSWGGHDGGIGQRRTNVSTFSFSAYNTNLAKLKIFLVTFLLALTEQTSLYPFVTNMSVGAESTILETFPVDGVAQFIFIHSSYLFGIFAGSLSLLHFTCWLWENPIYKIYIWFLSSSSIPFMSMALKGTKTNYYKYLNFIFLYLTMLCAIASIPYFGLDYTITNPLGFVADDRILYQINKKTNQPELPETAFLSTQASDRNTRDSRGRHGRRERWKDRLIKYRGMDTSLYEQSVYDLFTIEDLNYGFDKFWLRRKIKNHHSRFRMVIFQPWLLSLKKQLAKPRLISNDGVRVELFRMLYEQFYHPNFHAYLSSQKKQLPLTNPLLPRPIAPPGSMDPGGAIGMSPRKGITPISNTGYSEAIRTKQNLKKNDRIIENNSNNFHHNLDNKISERNFQDKKLIITTSALRKFVRKINTRIKSAQIYASKPFGLSRREHEIEQSLTNFKNVNKAIFFNQSQILFNPILKKVPDLTSKMHAPPGMARGGHENLDYAKHKIYSNLGVQEKTILSSITKKKDRQILRYKTLFNSKPAPFGGTPQNGGEGLSRREHAQHTNNVKFFYSINSAKIMLHPLKFYLQKEKAFKRKWQFYGANIFRKLSIENNAPYFRIMMKRLFYYYKPTLRWTNTLKLAKNKQGHKVRRKKSRIPLVYNPLQSNSNGVSSTPFAPPYALHEGGAKDWGSNTPIGSTLNLKAQTDILMSKSEEPGGSYILQDRVLTPSPPNLKKTTHNYRVVGKNASRYRYQIYKDVLQHWYYTPFNRLLLKFDIDAFIRRQPNAHFLTKKEEQELHLKRFLLSEHYDSLRWYTAMQHYRSMKTNIGGTKSFASRMYNHQFQGTFKKIRHLFAITPTGGADSVREIIPKNIISLPGSTNPQGLLELEGFKNFLNSKPVLKFDQLLYNEYSNTQQKSLINDSVIHEELFFPKKPDQNNLSQTPRPPFAPLGAKGVWGRDHAFGIGNDLIMQSTTIIKDYLKTDKEKHQEKIKNLLLTKNYNELTKLSLNDQKNSSSLNPEKAFRSEKHSLVTKNLLTIQKNSKIEQDLWFSTLKNLKKNLYDQEFLTKFLERRIKKKEKRQQKKEKELKNRLKRLKIWLSLNPQNSISAKPEMLVGFSGINPDLLTTGLKNAIKDGFLNINAGQSLTNFQQLPPRATPGGELEVGSSSNFNDFDFSSIVLKLQGPGGQGGNSEKNKLTSKDRLNAKGRGESLVSTTFLKTKIMVQSTTRNLKNILNLSINVAQKKLLKSLFPYNFAMQQDLKGGSLGLITWDIKDKIVKKRKLLKRKKYTKEIKKAQTTLPMTMRGKEQLKIEQTMPIGSKENKTFSLIVQQHVWRRHAKDLEGSLEGLSLGKKTNDSKLTLMPIKLETPNFISTQLPTISNIDNPPPGIARGVYGSFPTNLNNYIISKNTKTTQLATVGDSIAPAQQPPLGVGNSRGGIDGENTISHFESNLKKRKKNLWETGNEMQNIQIPKNDFLYFNTLYGKKFEFKQNFRRKKTKNRRNQRYGRPHHRVEHPSFNANLERKSANMVPEKRLQILKEQAELNYGLKSFNTNAERDLTKTQQELIKTPSAAFGDSPLWGGKAGDPQSGDEGYGKKKINLILNLKKRKSKKRNWKKYKKGSNNQGKALRKARKQNTSNYTQEMIATQLPGALTKQIKRIQLRLKLQQWWWKQFLPNLQVNQGLKGTTETNWQLEKERQLQKQISKLSKTEILERDLKPLTKPYSISPSLDSSNKPLNIGYPWEFIQTSQNSSINSGFAINDVPPAPFANPLLPPFGGKRGQGPLTPGPKAREEAPSLTMPLRSSPPWGWALPGGAMNPLPFYAGWDESLRKFVVTNRLLSRRETGYSIISQDDSQNLVNKKLNPGQRPGGGFDRGNGDWEIGEGASDNPYASNPPRDLPGVGVGAPKAIDAQTQKNQFNKNKIEFTNFPLQGMNAGTTLYCQVPFTTFDPDQLFSKGMDGFAPIGWRRFDFTHTIFKTQFNGGNNFSESSLNKNQTSSEFAWQSNTLLIQKNLLTKLQSKTEKITFRKPYYKDFNTIKKYTNYSRRLKKHYKRIKKLQNQAKPAVFLISGPLINQVLPIHYINVFNKQNRLSRDRYLKRLWLRHAPPSMARGGNGVKKGVPKAIKEFTTKNVFNSKQGDIFVGQGPHKNGKLRISNFYTNRSDFTLRRRLKTRRKYHRKASPTKGSIVRPRRHKFFTQQQVQLISTKDSPNNSQINQPTLRKRPSKRKVKKNQGKLTRDYDSGLTTKTRQRQKIQKTGALNARLRQLRRRVSRQVLKTVPTWRSHTRAGGFIWPGDYLRLEQTESPKLILKKESSDKETKLSKYPAPGGEQKITRKLEKKSILLDLYVQPRKYLLEKHNLKVLKKKLEKS